MMFNCLFVCLHLIAEATGYCARYSGQICKGFLSGGGEAVWFNISTSSSGGDWTVEQRLEGDGGGEQQQPLEVGSSAAAVSGGWLNEQLVTRLYQDVVRTLQPSCQPVAHVILLSSLLSTRLRVYLSVSVSVYCFVRCCCCCCCYCAISLSFVTCRSDAIKRKWSHSSSFSSSSCPF